VDITPSTQTSTRTRAVKATLFSAALGYSGQTYKGKTVMEVLQMSGGPPNDVGRAVCAAVLNAARGYNVIPSVDTVKGIWNEFASSGSFTPTAGVAVDGNGTIYVAWAGDAGVQLASGDGTTFTPIETGVDATGGAYPSVAVNADGSAVYVTWYEPETGTLMMGVQGDPGELGIAQPSPTPAPGAAPAPGGSECGKDGKISLDITASGTAFDPTCLVAPAGQPFTINFDNKDDAAATGPHNVAIATDSGYTNFVFTGDLISGPKQVQYKVDALDAGDYFFHCDVHPTMTGTFVVIEAKGKK
jgi:plastocyanin